jgi:hypothetical protein
MFHVKHSASAQLFQVNRTGISLLPDTEFRENRAQNVLHIDPADQSAEGMNRDSQMFRDQFRLIGLSCCCLLQRRSSFRQQNTVARAGDERAILFEMGTRKLHQGIRKFCNARTGFR